MARLWTRRRRGAGIAAPRLRPDQMQAPFGAGRGSPPDLECANPANWIHIDQV
jgi:hypothetical protein